MKGPPEIHFTPEQELLLWSIRVDHAKDQRIEEILKDGVDWNYVRETAIQHGIIPLLYKRLKEEMDVLVPSNELEELRNLFMANAVQNLRMTQQLIKVLDLLVDAGIEAMPFKGPALAVQAYGDLSMRSFCDLDIVIHRRDFEKVYTTLVKSGYSCALSRNQAQILLKTGIELTFNQPEHPIDIHWSFAHKFMVLNLDTDGLFEKSINIHILEKNFHGLSPEDTLLLLCIHGSNHYWCNLKWIADIIHLINRNPNINWQKISDLSGHFHVNILLYQGLSLAAIFGGLNIPEKIDKKMQSIIGKNDIINLYLFSPFLERKTFHHRLVLIKHLFFRSGEKIPVQVKYLLYQINYNFFTPKSRDLQVIDLPWCMYPLYFFIRPFRLLKDIFKICFIKSLHD